jgi:wyosine [tRNA(Phe)-imidazoG37] synthetase (radical SAM superfamily)
MSTLTPHTPDATPAPSTSTVYGPVTSWRVGASLGIDLLFQTSICSFNCIYCQLGDIQQKTAERAVYVPTDKVEWDLKNSAWEQADMVTFSGNGEPTLALNLAEVIALVKEYTRKPVMVLTNGTLLHLPAVRQDLLAADIVAVKLDAATPEGLVQMNRPVNGVTLPNIVAGAKALKQQMRPGHKMVLQCMFMATNQHAVEGIASLANEIQPDELQLNTPRRPYPKEWHRESRGNHGTLPYPHVALRYLDEAEAQGVEARIKAITPNISVVSIYKPTSTM